jgi:hypothetical protein
MACAFRTLLVRLSLKPPFRERYGERFAAANQKSVRKPRVSGEDQQNPFLARQPEWDDGFAQSRAVPTQRGVSRQLWQEIAGFFLKGAAELTRTEIGDLRQPSNGQFGVKVLFSVSDDVLNAVRLREGLIYRSQGDSPVRFAPALPWVIRTVTTAWL